MIRYLHAKAYQGWRFFLLHILSVFLIIAELLTCLFIHHEDHVITILCQKADLAMAAVIVFVIGYVLHEKTYHEDQKAVHAGLSRFQIYRGKRTMCHLYALYLLFVDHLFAVIFNVLIFHADFVFVVDGFSLFLMMMAKISVYLMVVSVIFVIVDVLESLSWGLLLSILYVYGYRYAIQSFAACLHLDHQLADFSHEVFFDQIAHLQLSIDTLMTMGIIFGMMLVVLILGYVAVGHRSFE